MLSASQPQSSYACFLGLASIQSIKVSKKLLGLTHIILDMDESLNKKWG